ncbi:MAG: aldehyde dehydrogenase family protein, partial [Acidimicrobiales bacterium]|nr:aldehyde dehydrogenase family protein [Acidimicrobiales bacterium]
MTTDQMLDRRKFYINGEWVDPKVPNDHEVINPSTEEACAVISFGSEDDTNAAVAAAKAAFWGWAETPREERVEKLKTLLGIYKERREEMAHAISLEMGAPIKLAGSAQVGAGMMHIMDAINQVENFHFDQPLGDHAPNDRILYEPVGVCAMITPWNWPMNQVTLKVAFALGAGCTMVLKPSEEAPLSSMLFAEMI